MVTCVRWRSLAASALRTVVSALPLVVSACSTLNTGGIHTAFDVAVLVGVDDTKNHPPNTAFSVNAVCGADQQLVGGGYRLINNSGATPTYVAVEGSFPSAANTWTVQARNPDNPALYNGDADVVVMALAYCVTTANYDLAIEIDHQDQTIPMSPTITADIDVRCSRTNALALSGGFKTTTLPVYSEPGGAQHQTFWPGLQGTGIVAEGPRFSDGTHSAMGWHVAEQYTPAQAPTAPQPQVTTTVFVVCANNGINNQSYRLSRASGTLAAGSPLEPTCQTGEFTVGGGYDGMQFTVGTAPTVEGSSATHTHFSFSGWQIAGSSGGLAANASALCVRIPQI